MQATMCLRLDGTSQWQSSGITLGGIATVNGTSTASCTLSNLDSQAVVVAQYTVAQQGGPGGNGPANLTVRVTQLDFTVRLPSYTPANFTDAAREQYIAALKQAATGECCCTVWVCGRLAYCTAGLHSSPAQLARPPPGTLAG